MMSMMKIIYKLSSQNKNVTMMKLRSSKLSQPSNSNDEHHRKAVSAFLEKSMVHYQRNLNADGMVLLESSNNNLRKMGVFQKNDDNQRGPSSQVQVYQTRNISLQKI